MTRKFEEIENDIKQMSPDQMKEFRAWYEDFDSGSWGKQIEEDAASGKLDDLASKALRDHKVGESIKL